MDKVRYDRIGPKLPGPEAGAFMAHSKSLSRPRRSLAPLADQAYYTIRERILRGVLPPGAVLSRRDLARDFRMSFLPISEALQRLESEGLVESRPRVGTRVRTPTVEEVRGRYVVREALEAKSAELCCERASFQERLELRRMAEDLDVLYARSGAGERDTDFLYIVHQHHMSFHLRIAEYARCDELRTAIEKNNVLIYNWFFDVTADRRELPARFHSELAEAVAGEDPAAAVRALREHIRYGLEGILRAVAEYSAAAEWRLKRSRGHSAGPESVTECRCASQPSPSTRAPAERQAKPRGPH